MSLPVKSQNRRKNFAAAPPSMTTPPPQFLSSPPLAADEEDDTTARDDDKFREILRQNRIASRNRLRTRIKLLHREISKPLADVVRNHVLHRLPARSVLCLRAVAPSWDRFVSSPIFAHTQSQTHRSISGVFFRSSSSPGTAAYAPFPPAAAHSVRYPDLSFLPASPVAVLSSSNGLLLCHAPSTGTFCICNPVTAAWTFVPDPPRKPMTDPAAVLICLPSVYNFRPDYSVVIPFEVVNARMRIYGFQTFSSTAGDWWISNDLWISDELQADCLYPDSGVGVGGAAYWITSMSAVVRYDPAADRVSRVFQPTLDVERAQWQIGGMGHGGRLYCIVVTQQALQVHKLLGEPSEWALVESLDVMSTRGTYADGDEEREEGEGEGEVWEVLAGGEVAFKKRPWPLRFQGGDMEILLWVAGKVVGVDLATKRVRVTAAAGGSPRDIGGCKYVPYISTLAAVPSMEAAATSTSSGGAVAVSPPRAGYGNDGHGCSFSFRRSCFF